MTGIYRFIAYGGARFDTDKVIGLMMSTNLEGAEQMVRGGKLTQQAPEGVKTRRWFGLIGKSANGVMIDELQNGDVEMYYPNDFGGYMDALCIFLLLMTYAQLGAQVCIVQPDGTKVTDILNVDAADTERQMSQWLTERMMDKYAEARANGQATVPGFRCPMILTDEYLDHQFGKASADDLPTLLFNAMIDLQWSYDTIPPCPVKGKPGNLCAICGYETCLVDTDHVDSVQLTHNGNLYNMTSQEFGSIAGSLDGWRRLDAKKWVMIGK